MNSNHQDAKNTDKKRLQCVLHDMAVLAVSIRLLDDKGWSKSLKRQLDIYRREEDWSGECLREAAKISALISFRALHDFLYEKPGGDDVSITHFRQKRPQRSPYKGFVKLVNKYVAHITDFRVENKNRLAHKCGERRIRRRACCLLRRAQAFVKQVRKPEGFSGPGTKYYALFEQAMKHFGISR